MHFRLIIIMEYFQNPLHLWTQDNVNASIIMLLIVVIILNWVRLMCALRAHINKSIFGKVLLGIEKVVKTFSISNKLFSKLVYYCVP